MAVIYNPATVREYYKTVKRLDQIQEEYDSLEGDEASAFHEEHWADLKAQVVPPPLNALILEEFMETHERQQQHLANAILEFKKIPEGMEKPANAITLWKAICHGLDRIADGLSKAPER